MSLAPEDAAFDHIKAAVEAAAEGNALRGAELLDDGDNVTQDFGVSVSDSDGADIAPARRGGAMDEFDVIVMLACYARVEGTDKTDKTARRAARAKARDIALEVAKLFNNNETMGGKVRNSRVLRGWRGFDSLESGEVYAVMNLPLIVNETGRPVRYEASVQS